MKNTMSKSLILAGLLSAFSANALAEDWTSNVRLSLGGKHLKSSDWKDKDEHSSIGLIMDFKPSSWPVAIAVDMFGTGEHKSDNTNNNYTSEIHLGGRFSKGFMQDRIQPYVGAGLAGGYAVIETQAKDYEGQGAGGWVGLGVDFKVYNNIKLGLDARYSSVKASILGKKRNIGGTNVGVTLGYQF